MEEFVTFDIAKKLNEKGFNWICSHYYRTNDKKLFMIFPSEDWSYIEERISAPTISQALKWLREVKKIHIGVLYHGYYAVWIQPMKRNEAEHVIHECKTNEAAELEGIEFILDNNLI